MSHFPAGEKTCIGVRYLCISEAGHIQRIPSILFFPVFRLASRMMANKDAAFNHVLECFLLCGVLCQETFRTKRERRGKVTQDKTLLSLNPIPKSLLQLIRCYVTNQRTHRSVGSVLGKKNKKFVLHAPQQKDSEDLSLSRRCSTFDVLSNSEDGDKLKSFLLAAAMVNHAELGSSVGTIKRWGFPLSPSRGYTTFSVVQNFPA